MFGYVERMVVTLAFVAAFVILAVTHNLTSQVLAIFAPLLGMIGVAWYTAHSQQNEQQASQPPKAQDPPSQAGQ